MRAGQASSQNADGLAGIGEIKWFGGINKATGRPNNFGFIATRGGDLYFHRSSSLSPPEILIEGAKVAFIAVEEAKGKVAQSVQVISKMDDEALTTLIKGAASLGPDEVLTAISFMKSIGAVQDEVFRALTA
jgi:cold shock CspA family protein